MSLLPTMLKASVKAAEEEDYIDPAEYIFKHEEHHNCFFIVGSDNDKIEKISALSYDLVAHSSVFRKLLLDNTSEVRITDISPQVFKLILTYVYGGELPYLDRHTAAQLALAAGLYNIRPLVTRACKLIVPESAADIFPALLCVANMSCPDLEPHVTKIVQDETQAVLNSDQFLDLDDKCVQYIMRQENLSVIRLELCKALIRWAQHKADTSSMSMVEHLENILPAHMTLGPFSLDITREVIPSKILTAEQVTELQTAVTNDQPLESQRNDIREVRELSVATVDNGPIQLVDLETVFETERMFSSAAFSKLAENDEYNAISILTIEAHSRIRINFFTLQTKSMMKLGNQPLYKLECTITVRKVEETGFLANCKEVRCAHIEGTVLGNREITFPVMLSDGQPLILEGGANYIFTLELNSPHPVYSRIDEDGMDDTFQSICNFKGITVTYATPLHVKSMQYSL